MGLQWGLDYENMSHDVTNFLPPDRIHAFKRGYVLRLTTVVLGLFIGVLIAHGILLVPSYVYTTDRFVRLTAEMQMLSLAMEDRANENVSARLQSIETTGATILQSVTTASASAVLAQVLAVPRPAIALSGMSVDVAKEKGGMHKMRITGIANTREALRSYYLALTQLPSVSGVDLPLSAYAKDTDIAFSMDVQITSP